MKNERGVTLIILILTILVLIIITSMLVSNSFNSIEVSNLAKLNSDIKALEDRVASYYVKNNTLPIFGGLISKNDIINIIDDLNSDDGDKYYALDLNKLDNPTLYYGQGYTVPNEDMYIINTETHTVYYLKGITYEGIKYHTIGDY